MINYYYKTNFAYKNVVNYFKTDRVVYFFSFCLLRE